MANISDKTNLTGHVDLKDGKQNWISQINAGGTVYDIATHHSVTFVEGNGGAKTVWNGLTDLEVVIPSITDIVQTPIEFAGTVGADGKITWVNGQTKAEAGSLVFITENCTFDGKPCEKGDMAIYDGTKWYTVSGEHQIDIVGNAEGNKVTVAVGSAKDVLTVEGKTLALTLDYAELDGHVALTKGGVTDVDCSALAVGKTYVKLVKAADTTPTIGEVKEFDKATKLADGTVTLTNATGLVKGIKWGEFNPGTETKSTMNTAKDFSVTGGDLTLSSNLAKGDFVDSVSMEAVTFEGADDSDENKIVFVSEIVAGEGKSFFNGVAATKAGETADITIPGYVAPKSGINTTFVTGLEGGLKAVTSITDGNFELVSGATDLATGFGTAVTGNGGEVLSNVTVTPVKNANVLSSATVTDHVLSFGDVNVMSDVTVAYESKSLTKTGFKYTAPKATNTAFTTDGFEKVADVNYTFGTGKETTYGVKTEKWKLNTPAITTTFGTYDFNDAGMLAHVTEGMFVSSVTAGQLPTLAASELVTTDVTGTVGTELTTVKESFNALTSNTITMPGAYTLENTAGEGAIEVGAAGALAAQVGSIDLKDFVTDVTISTTKQ